METICQSGSLLGSHRGPASPELGCNWEEGLANASPFTERRHLYAALQNAHPPAAHVGHWSGQRLCWTENSPQPKEGPDVCFRPQRIKQGISNRNCWEIPNGVETNPHASK